MFGSSPAGAWVRHHLGMAVAMGVLGAGQPTLDVFAARGDMAQRCRAFDWPAAAQLPLLTHSAAMVHLRTDLPDVRARRTVEELEHT